MPGRAVRRDGAQPSSRSRARASRASSPGTNVPDEGESTTLRIAVSQVFSDVHKTSTGHRKLVVSLRKIQERCCYEPTNPKRQSAEDEFDETDFNGEVVRCVTRILWVRKSEPAGDRIVKFMGMFLKHATEQDNAIFQGESEEMMEVPETPSSRLTSQVLTLVLPLLVAKDKVVRFRCAQITAHLINNLDSIDDELFDYVRLGLIKRLRDKESAIRVQAVYGLGRLAGDAANEDDVDDSDDESSSAGGILGKLLDLLQNDPSAEVRRALLLNLPFTPATLPLLLERARDQDAGIRRALYGRLLPALGDFRHLSLTHREKLLRWGLRDRDDNVRKAAAKLFGERWIEDCARPRDENGEPIEMPPGQAVEPKLDGLMELLERIDIVNAGNEGGIAIDAMRDFWERRPDYRDIVKFDEEYWRQLTPESVFIARTFNDFCRLDGTPEELQDKIPEVTRLAFLLQSNVNDLVNLVREIAVKEDAEEDSVQQEFVVEQLLRIALTLDYSDEVGRRTMFSLMREALTLAELPEESTRLVVEVLRITCGDHAAGEREFCGIVLEAIAEVHDTIMGEDLPQEDDPDESFHSARSELSGDHAPSRQQNEELDEEKAIREIMVNMKCLHIAQCMLQNVDCSLEQNAHLVTMLNNLVVPAVRSQEAPIRERGLLCLGLCCLLDKNLATENLTLFLHCFNKGHEELQCIAIQIISDVLSAHPAIVMSPTQSEASNDADEAVQMEHALHKPIYKLFAKSLKSPITSIQSTGCTALCKLMLSAPSTSPSGTTSILNNEEMLKLLVQAYFDPESSSNPALRQALSYFLPVYCHSRKDNMQRMGQIAISIICWHLSLKEEMDVDAEDETSDELVSIAVVSSHLVDWTDGRRLAVAVKGFSEHAVEDADSDVHLDLASAIYEKMLGVCSKEEKKALIMMLGKIHIGQASDPAKLKEVQELTEEAINDRLASDATTKTALNKLQQNLSKAADGPRPSDVAGRRRSVAPSAALDHDQDEEAANSDIESIASAMTTPAASPFKRLSRRPSATMDSDSVAELGHVDVFGRDSVTPGSSPQKKRNPRASQAPPLHLMDVIDEDEVTETIETPTTPAISPVKASRNRESQKSVVAAADAYREALAPTTRGNRTRGKRQAKVTLDEDEDTVMGEAGDDFDEPQVKLENDDDESNRLLRKNSRAARAVAGRRSVRASRRLTASLAPEDE